MSVPFPYRGCTLPVCPYCAGIHDPAGDDGACINDCAQWDATCAHCGGVFGVTIHTAATYDSHPRVKP